MKKLLAAIALSLCVLHSTAGKIKGKVTDAKGQGIAYVNLGVRNTTCGTLSDKDGNFSINVPDSLAKRPISFSHLSFVPLDIPQSHEMAVVMTAAEYQIPEVVVRPGKPRERQLVNQGIPFPGAGCATKNEGGEIGSVIDTKYPALIKEIQFTISSNDYDSATLRVNVYRIDDDTTLVNIVRRQIYCTVPGSRKAQYVTITPEEKIWLDPGRYFVSLEFVELKGGENKKHTFVSFPAYIKKSYLRENSMGRLSQLPLNIGLSVMGIEYR